MLTVPSSIKDVQCSAQGAPLYGLDSAAVRLQYKGPDYEWDSNLSDDIAASDDPEVYGYY